MDNRAVATILRETAQLLEIDGAFIARRRSYERASELIESLPEPIAEIAKDTEKLTALPGVGERMAEHIQEILSTGDYVTAASTSLTAVRAKTSLTLCIP
jgi:DNA polymerase (family 10)